MMRHIDFFLVFFCVLGQFKEEMVSGEGLSVIKDVF